MIFSQAQKQGMLVLIGMVLAGYALHLFFKEKPRPITQKVIPLLLEAPKKKYKKMSQSDTISSYSKPTYKKRKKPYAKSRPSFQHKPKPVITIINLNVADSAELDAIPGIGAKTSLRILKYKSLIGQFVAVEQLKRVYGISEENYNRMVPYFKVERVGEIDKKDLNGEKTYKIAWIIGKEKAEQLTSKRKEISWFQDWNQVAELEILSKQEMAWMQAYYKIPHEKADSHR